MTRRLAGFAAAAALVGAAVLSAGAGTTAVAGNSWDRTSSPPSSQGAPNTGTNDGNSWD